MLKQEESLLVIVDVQGRLADVMHDRDPLFANINRLAGTAGILDIPILITEQLPEKLGPTRREDGGQRAQGRVPCKGALAAAGASRGHSGHIQKLLQLRRRADIHGNAPRKR